MSGRMKPNWRLRCHMSFTSKHSLLYRDDDLHVQMEIHTPYRNGVPGKGKTYYFIDNDKREFRTEADLIAALESTEAGE